MLNYKLILFSLAMFILAGCSTGSYTIDEPIETFGEEYYLKVARGEVEGVTSIHKFGAGTLTTSFAPITQSNTYQTPTTATALEFLSDDIDDTFLGAGARQITIQGLNSSWQEVSMVINTSGLTPVQLPTDLIRLYRWYVSSSGSYANPTTTSHQGNLIIRESGGGTTWSTITNTPIAVGQSQIGVYTIPKGKVGYLRNKNVFTDTSKTADIYLFNRCNADDVVAPYNGTRRLIEREVGVSGGLELNFVMPKGGFTGPCDIGFIGAVSVGTADVSVEFELILFDVE